jgi:hypothetical protein
VVVPCLNTGTGADAATITEVPAQSNENIGLKAYRSLYPLDPLNFGRTPPSWQANDSAPSAVTEKYYRAC